MDLFIYSFIHSLSIYYKIPWSCGTDIHRYVTIFTLTKFMVKKKHVQVKKQSQYNRTHIMTMQEEDSWEYINTMPHPGFREQEKFPRNSDVQTWTWRLGVLSAEGIACTEIKDEREHGISEELNLICLKYWAQGDKWWELNPEKQAGERSWRTL